MLESDYGLLGPLLHTESPQEVNPCSSDLSWTLNKIIQLLFLESLKSVKNVVTMYLSLVLFCFQLVYKWTQSTKLLLYIFFMMYSEFLCVINKGPFKLYFFLVFFLPL